MRNDFAPFYRSTIGFDRMLDLLDHASQIEPQDGFPPFDIERVGDDHYRLTIALAGYGADDLSVTAEANTLLIEGRKPQGQEERKYLHRGIARRDFKRQFELADFVKVAGASYDNGLLSVDLERELPEAMKPRRIEISNVDAARLRRTERTPNRALSA